ncbi:conjugative transposon protein TraN [Sphingobacterium yanglingense]|uniref:Conjugative transposon TraN protein n=1 Tax=Sphingobacterium yanglingense TaxID=1437280 RepID=A0A4R6W8T2_9SPHI|nr:conjugative transposon protein TraN [Sphingobacterium yanglingense]TDQ73802.1 conjugative transposon TraN protein [Sphingobacterium yanglingense]
MKKLCRGVLCAMLLIISNVFIVSAQDIETDKLHLGIPVIEIANDKTTNLIFPFSIISVDRGSSEVMVQKAKGVKNVLQLKSAEEDFAETNLTVITSDGSLYSFLLVYNHFPFQTNYVLNDMKPFRFKAELHDTNSNEAILFSKSTEVSLRKAFLKKLSKAYGVSIQIQGIYIYNGIMYFKVQLSNNTQIPYNVEQFRFYIKDKKLTKRTASQELEISPINIHGHYEAIPANSNIIVIVAMEKFTIPDKKIFHIEMLEKNGGRNLHIKIKNKDLIKCRQL